jgi:ribosome-associated protein
MNNVKILLDNIISSIQEVKGKEIVSLNLQKTESTICKYFVICTGNSNTHVNAIERSIRNNISKKLKEKPYNIEGNKIAEWILLDYSDIIVHIFQKNIRLYYNLEDFWGDADCVNYKVS